MISLELARKLKEAGLEWEPQMYDFFTMIILEKPIIACVTDKWTLDSVRKEVLEFKGERRLFLPRLDQLLAEIEKRGYTWSLELTDEGKYVINIFKGAQGVCCKIADSPEEAAAEALLWICDRGADRD
jgi:hypothetical protein